MTQGVLDTLLTGHGPPHQDYVLLAGMKTPGRARLRGWGAPRKWDERVGYGLSGASLVYGGDKLGAGSLFIDIWDEADEEWERWERVAKLLEKPPFGTVPKALIIIHPILNRSPLGISSVVVDDPGQWDHDDEGLWTIEIKLRQFRKPKPILVQPAASTPGVANVVPDAKTVADVQTALLTAQVDVNARLIAAKSGGR